jgi:hypothetical protein
MATSLRYVEEHKRKPFEVDSGGPKVERWTFDNLMAIGLKRYALEALYHPGEWVHVVPKPDGT